MASFIRKIVINHGLEWGTLFSEKPPIAIHGYPQHWIQVMEPTPWQQRLEHFWVSQGGFLISQPSRIFPIQTWIFSYKSLISPLKPLCFLGIFIQSCHSVPKTSKNTVQVQVLRPFPGENGRTTPQCGPHWRPWRQSGRGMLWEASSRAQACAPVCATQPKITSSTWRTQHVYTHHISYIIYGYIYNMGFDPNYFICTWLCLVDNKLFARNFRGSHVFLSRGCRYRFCAAETRSNCM